MSGVGAWQRPQQAVSAGVHLTRESRGRLASGDPCDTEASLLESTDANHVNTSDPWDASDLRQSDQLKKRPCSSTIRASSLRALSFDDTRARSSSRPPRQC